MRCCCCFRRCRPRRWWPRIAWHRVGSACFSEPTVTRLSPRTNTFPKRWLTCTMTASTAAPSRSYVAHLQSAPPRLPIFATCRRSWLAFWFHAAMLARSSCQAMLSWRPQESTDLPPRAQSLKEHQQSCCGAHCSVKWNRRPSDWDGQRPGPSLSAARKRGRRLPGASLLNPAAPSLKQIYSFAKRGPTLCRRPLFGGLCDSQATGGSENVRSVKLGGDWGERH